MIGNLKSAAAGFVLAVAASANAAGAGAPAPHGFEVNGFTQGMHEGEANDLARHRGFELHDTASGTVISKGGQADSALFCRDELLRYAHATHGGFMKFLREIKSFEGQGYRRTNMDLGTQMTPDAKELGHLTIYFFRPGDNYFVTIMLLGTEDNDTDNFTVEYEALDKAAKCQH
jgi:hypothetical protein